MLAWAYRQEGDAGAARREARGLGPEDERQLRHREVGRHFLGGGGGEAGTPASSATPFYVQITSTSLLLFKLQVETFLSKLLTLQHQDDTLTNGAHTRCSVGV